MKSLRITLLVLLTIHIAIAQNARTKRINAVENGLIPYVPVKGFPSWNLIDRMKYYQIPGASITVINDFKIDWSRGYGHADTTRKTSVTSTTMFSAGSVSKLVTAVIALRLVDQGKLALDVPVNQYLRRWKISNNDFTKETPITLAMLLSHTAGTSQSAYFGYLPSKTPLPTVLQVLNGDPVAEVNPVVVNSRPGAEFRYSGGGYMIVQMIIEEVTGKTLQDAAAQEIFIPLGMDHTTFEQPLPAKFQDKAAWGYSAAPWYKGVPYVYPQQAAAGLYSTSIDLAKFMIALQKSYQTNGGLLRRETMKKMLSPKAEISRGTYLEQIGLGAFLLERGDNTLEDGKYFEHQGANAGFITFAFASQTGGKGVVMMLNSGDDFNGFATEVRRSVAKAYSWKNFLPDEIKPNKLNTTVLDQYVGRYKRGTDEVVYIRREGDHLVEKINDGRDIYMFPVGIDTFAFTDFTVKGYFQRDDAGRVKSLRTDFQTIEQRMPRMADQEFTPSEHLKARRYSEAKEGFRSMNMNEYQLTYFIYSIVNSRNDDMNAARMLLDLALENFPNSSIVYSRLGDFYLKQNDKARAIESYKKSLELDPTNKEVKTLLENLPD